MPSLTSYDVQWNQFTRIDCFFDQHTQDLLEIKLPDTDMKINIADKNKNEFYVKRRKLRDFCRMVTNLYVSII